MRKGRIKTEVEQRITLAIAELQPGEVVSYGDIARRAGIPRAPRAVGRLLASTGDVLPWWRVVRADGSLLKTHLRTQTDLLTQEGVVVRRGRILTSPLGRFTQ